MILRLFPKKVDFFEVFDKVASNNSKAATLLLSFMENFDNMDAREKEIFALEQDSDILTHDIIKKLNSTYFHPIDSEDLYALATKLDDILDLIWAITGKLTIFKLKESTKEAIEMSKDLLNIVDLVHEAIKKLREKNYSLVEKNCIEINRLENLIDRVYRNALGKLFDEIKDPILIIKWKEIYDYLEYASDKCEDIADVLETIVIKHT